MAMAWLPHKAGRVAKPEWRWGCRRGTPNGIRKECGPRPTRPLARSKYATDQIVWRTKATCGLRSYSSCRDRIMMYHCILNAQQRCRSVVAVIGLHVWLIYDWSQLRI